MFRFSHLACSTALSLSFAAQAVAQEVVTEEFLITTQKREQRLEDVPVTVSAFSGQFLEDINVSEFDELSLFTPGLTVQEQSPNNPGFVIRGITSDDGSAQSAPRVSIYLNGVDVSRSRGSYFDLFDIERIEVVKGPQSTLFGTAAAIGAISVITRKAEPGVSGEASITYGNYNNVRSQGFINAGNDKIAGRLAWSYKDRDGFVENQFSRDGNFSENLNGQNLFGLRGSIHFEPTDNITIDFVGNYEQQKPPGTAFISGSIPPPGGDTSPFSPVSLSGSPFAQDLLGGDALGLDRKVWDGNLTAVWEIDETWSVTSITAYRNFDSVELFDADGSQIPWLEFAEDATGDQWNQEIRVNYTGDALTAFFGANYFTEDGAQVAPFATEEGIYLQCSAGLVPGLPCVGPDGTAATGSGLATGFLTNGFLSELPYGSVFSDLGQNDSWSFYADATYAVTDSFEISAGLRYITEERWSGYSAVQPNSVILGLLQQAGVPGVVAAPLLPIVDTGGAVVSAEDSFDAWLPRFNALYRLTDEMNVYATISKGRRSPVVDVDSGLSGGEVVADVTFVPAEIIWNYEAGVKGNFFDNRLFASFGLFYQDYSNFQASLIDDAGAVIVVNAGEATNVGAEAEFNAQLTEELRLFGSAAYIDASIDGDGTNTQFADNRFRLQPKWAAALGAIYEREISDDVAMFGTVSWTFEGAKFFELPNDPNIAEDRYSLVNLRAGLKSPEETWQVEAFVSNLFDKEFIIDGGNVGQIFGTPTFIPGNPRFYGIEVTGRF